MASTCVTVFEYGWGEQIGGIETKVACNLEALWDLFPSLRPYILTFESDINRNF